MTLADINDTVYQQLPSVHRVLGGRRLINRIVRRAVAGWPVPVLEQCDARETDVVGKYYSREIERAVKAEVQMGFLAMLIFSAMVQEIVRILVRWWLERHENRNQMRLLVREARQ